MEERRFDPPTIYETHKIHTKVNLPTTCSRLFEK